MKTVRWFVFFLLLLSLPAAGYAQQPAAAPKVKIPVCLQGPRPDALEGLKLANFKLFQEKTEVTPSFFLGSEAPLLLCVAFDTTGDPTWYDAMRKELLNFVKVLPPGVQMMVMTLNDGLKVVESNTADREKLSEAIQSYNTNGHPGFIENVLPLAENMNGLFMRHPVRVATLLITDSDIYRYRKQYTTSDYNTEADRIKDKLKETCAPVYAIRLPVTNNDTFNRSYEGSIREIMKATGGDAEFPLALSGVPNALVAILHKMHFTYVLGYDPPDAKPGREYKIKVELAGAEAKPEYRKSFRLPK